uniref:Peripla_BP_6 domain-containing protein n=1 Tax=Steinernema glaseri TaxID=37863 RepID=A0A1I7Y3A1_9BILA
MTVGVILSTTGPGASLGIPERNTVALLPREIAGQAVKYVVLDDASDSTAAAKNARKLIAKESQTAQIALAPFSSASGEQSWIFTIAQTNTLMAQALIEHMQQNGVKTLAYIGYNDVWGEDWHKVLSEMAPAAGITLVRDERFNRTDSSVSGQALKVMSSKPDAVLIGATGTPAALPHTELRRLGYKGTVYHTHGAANSAFLRIGDKALNGAILPVGPVV